MNAHDVLPPRRLRITSLACAFAITLFMTLTVSEASTFLFDNLRTIGSRLDTGDPALSGSGQIFDGPKDIAVARFNSDALPDIAVANRDGTVTVYLAAGGGQFGPPAHLRTGGGELRGLALADFTGDGLCDIAVGAPYTGKVFMFHNQGGGTFRAGPTLPAWSGARDLAAGDFDGDGRIDLAVAGTTEGVTQYRNTGGGNFLPVAKLTNFGLYLSDFPQPAFYLKTLRLPGATRDELVVGRAQMDNVSVLAADAEGRLTIHSVVGGVSATALDVGPVLRRATNPVPDLVVAHSRSGQLVVYPAGAQGGARFSTNSAQRLFIPGGPRNVRVVDLDGDGWNDLVVVQQTFNNVLTFRNQDGWFVPASSAAVGTQPREMDVGDFNGDGSPDVAVLNRQSSDVSVLLTFPGSVGFGTKEGVYPVDGRVSALEVRDFNKDGRDDVIQLHLASGELSVRLAGTNGALSEPTYYPAGLRPIGRVVTDVNKDGLNDVVTTDFSPKVTVRLGLPGGGLGPPRDFGLPDPIPTGGLMGMMLPSARDAQLFSVEAADFDGDGSKDLAVGFWDCRVGFYKGAGDGTFVFTRAYVTFREPRGMTAGDYDQDGDLDLATASIYPKVAIIENRGNIMTVPEMTATIFDTGIYSTSAMKSLDANEDGDLDLLLVGDTGMELYVGGPGLQFTKSTNTVTIPGLDASSAATADFDGDGDEDLATACAAASCVSILLGDGAGSYVPFLTVDVPAAQLLASGDLDGDGLPDLVGTGGVLWTALSGHLQRTNAPPPLPGPRPSAPQVVINEILPINNSLPLDEDEGRNSDWIELYNGADVGSTLAGWRLVVVLTNVTGIAETNSFGFTNQFTPTNWVVTTNEYVFPNGAFLEPGGYRLIVCTRNLRSQFHSGFPLPGSGATICLFDAQGAERDRADYPSLRPDVSYSRFQDGSRTFVVCAIPTPGMANADSGAVQPSLQFGGLDESSIGPGQPIRFFASATDDVGIMTVDILYRRLDGLDTNVYRLALADDGMSEDGAWLDGAFSGVLSNGFPAGAEIEFYVQCRNFNELTVSSPGNPVFSRPGQLVTMHSLAIGLPKPTIEISEIVADNTGSLRDEAGGTPDWIELRNYGPNPVSLGNMSLAPKLFGNDSRIRFTNTLVLDPGQHLVFYADDNEDQGPLHAPFQLDKDGGRIVLAGTGPRGARIPVETLIFGQQSTNRAWARLGSGGPWRETTPTPFAPNISGGWDGLVASNRFVFGFLTEPNVSYVVEQSDSIVKPVWRALPAVSGDGVEKTVSVPLQDKGFFRVRRQ